MLVGQQIQHLGDTHYINYQIQFILPGQVHLELNLQQMVMVTLLQQEVVLKVILN